MEEEKVIATVRARPVQAVSRSLQSISLENGTKIPDIKEHVMNCKPV